MNMTKSVFFFLLMCWLTLPVSLLAQAQTLLRVASPEFPPYVYKLENGEVGGVVSEIVAEVFQNMGVDYKNTIYPWARALRMLKVGQTDSLYTIMKSKDREALFHYPDEHLLDARWVFFIRRADVGKLKFDSFDDLKGKRIGLALDTKYSEALWEFVKKENNYELVVGEELNLKKLFAGRIDYTVCDYLTGMFLAKTLGIEDRVAALTANPIDSTHFYIAFNQQNVERTFVKQFSDELKKFKSGARYKQILQKHNIPQ
ncbi:substrate-binding periplasmic protein [Agarivorans sp. QJM3NY_33]|uniref:substrate-binding periplasmic protein n=1 Tax=Agarivorans sp. QJM3NY_33 TaxID=3421432 RepID=UPI003D7D2EA3